MNLIGLDANQLDVAKEGLAGILIFYIILDVGSHLSMYALGESLRRMLSISGIFLAISFVLLLIYVQLFGKSTAMSTFVVIWIVFTVFDQLLFFSPSIIFYMRDGALPGFLLSTAAATLTGIVVSMNIYALKYSISKSLGSLFSGSSVRVTTSTCASCSSITLFLATSFGTAGLAVSTFLSNYQIHLRLLSVVILIWAYYSVHKKITTSCSKKI